MHVGCVGDERISVCLGLFFGVEDKACEFGNLGSSCVDYCSVVFVPEEVCDDSL